MAETLTTKYRVENARLKVKTVNDLLKPVVAEYHALNEAKFESMTGSWETVKFLWTLYKAHLNDANMLEVYYGRANAQKLVLKMVDALAFAQIEEPFLRAYAEEGAMISRFHTIIARFVLFLLVVVIYFVLNRFFLVSRIQFDF